MSIKKTTIEQIKQEIDSSLAYAEAEEVAKYANKQATMKRNKYFDDIYNKLVVLKKDVFVDEKYSRTISLCKLLGGISKDQFFNKNNFIETRENKKREFDLLKVEIEKEIDYLNNNNQKERAKKYSEAITIPKNQVSIDQFSIGQLIDMGTYPYDRNGSRKRIKWKVLDKKDNKLLLITNGGIDCKKYNETSENVTWGSCTIRKWLNNEFYNLAFSDKMKDLISITTVKVNKHQKHKTKQENDTKDRIFLLSIQEVEKYFKTPEERKCIPTEYAVSKGVWENNTIKLRGKSTCNWWLRSSDSSSRNAPYVISDGRLSDAGSSITNSSFTVRPALWLNL